MEELKSQFAPKPTLQDLVSLAVPDGAPRKMLDGNVTTKIQERLFCFGSGDFKHKNIYVFMMDADPAHSTVLFNGNNFDLNGGNLELEDEKLEGNDKTIAGLFNRKLAGGTSAYANYRWDDPIDTEDEIENWFEMNSVPGTSPKRSYIEVADLYGMLPEAVSQLADDPTVTPAAVALGFPPQRYIFGSGVYPDEPNVPNTMGDTDDTDDTDNTDNTDDTMDKPVTAVSDGGCAITGTSNTSQGTLLNLFLIASVLFSVVFLRRRA